MDNDKNKPRETIFSRLHKKRLEQANRAKESVGSHPPSLTWEPRLRRLWTSGHRFRDPDPSAFHDLRVCPPAFSTTAGNRCAA